MRWIQFNKIVVALALAAALVFSTDMNAKSPATITVTVEDSSGALLQGASVYDASGQLLGRTDASGVLTVQCVAPCQHRITAEGFAEQSVTLTADTTIRLAPTAGVEELQVTAYRTPLSELESPAATRVLLATALNTTAAITLDGELRQLPGIELFRRSSSLVANPTSQGVSLRGLGSTSASRTLVVEDDVPQNDVLGGWIHWQEQPELAVKSIEVERGGASDLYGSSAIGGVIDLLAKRPTADTAQLRSSYGGEGTFDDSLLLEAKGGRWGVLATGGAIGTDGYIQESPAQRGPVDTTSFVHSQNVLLMNEHDRGPLRIFARGSGFNEARGNGTRYQSNGTRIWRYATGSDWKAPHDGLLALRLYGSSEHFRQTFSSISNLPNFGVAGCNYRCGETPTKLSLTPNNELGAAAHWNQPLGAGLMLLGGADVHDARIWDREQVYAGTRPLTNLRDHQRDSAVYLEAMWVRKSWTLVASGRMDWYQNYDGYRVIWQNSAWLPSPPQPTQGDQRVFDPRMGISRKLGNHLALSASGFRAFRAPTPNELYRSTTVGSQTTNPNSALLSERATGWEAGIANESRWGAVRASYFLTQVNRPITAVAISATTLVRVNLGQIESRGLALDYEIAPRRWLALDGGYQYANATVTNAGGISLTIPGTGTIPNPGITYQSNWIPEVAHNMATANLRAYRSSIGTLNLQGRLSGRQYDDAANSYLLHGYFRLDAYAEHDFGRRIEFFTAGENLFSRQIEVAKTPTTTLAAPRVARMGFLIKFGGAGR